MKLLNFQIQGLFWLVKREQLELNQFNPDNDFMNPIWKEYEAELRLFNPDEEQCRKIKENLSKQNPKNFRQN